MRVELRSLTTALLPAIVLLFIVYLFADQLSRFPAILKPVQLYLPYAVLAIGMLLSGIFNHSREFNVLLWLAICYTLIDYSFWRQHAGHLNVTTLYALICLLTPFNFVTQDLLRERGIINLHGLKRFLIIALQLGLMLWLSIENSINIHTLVHINLYQLPWLQTPIPQLAMLLILISSITLLIYVLVRPNILQGTFLASLLAAVLALHHIEQPVIASFYFTLAGLIIIFAIVINSHHLAYKDELTQLPSRRALKQQLMSLGSQYSIAMVDVDHFKKLNDSYGHDVGDQVLKMLANQLRKVKGGGKAFRYGGEEFTLVFPGKDSATALAFVEELRERIANTPFSMRNKSRPKQKPEKPKKTKPVDEINISVSIGLAENSDQTTSPQAVIKLADQALYKAKKGGRNQVMNIT